MYSGRRIGVVRPGYSGHLLAWGEMPVTAMSADDLEAAAQAHDVIVLANPNNPDGRVLPRERLLAVRSALAARTGMLIVDEAFADVLPEHSVCSSTCAGLIVFRSFVWQVLRVGRLASRIRRGRAAGAATLSASAG
jgi:cobalamin biosynthetic protein CobC